MRLKVSQKLDLGILMVTAFYSRNGFRSETWHLPDPLDHFTDPRVRGSIGSFVLFLSSQPIQGMVNYKFVFTKIISFLVLNCAIVLQLVSTVATTTYVHSIL